MQNQNVVEKQISSVIDSAIELSNILKSNPQLIEKEEFEKGKNLIQIFESNLFAKILPPDIMNELPQIKKKIITFAIDDLSDRSSILSQSVIGYKVMHMSLVPFNEPLYQYIKGNNDPRTLFYVSLKTQKQTNYEGPVELNMDQMNSAIYYLIVLLSQIE